MGEAVFRSWSSELELEGEALGHRRRPPFLGTDPTIANKIKGLTGSVPVFTDRTLHLLFLLFFVAKNKNQPPRTVDDRGHMSSIDRRPVL